MRWGHRSRITESLRKYLTWSGKILLSPSKKKSDALTCYRVRKGSILEQLRQIRTMETMKWLLIFIPVASEVEIWSCRITFSSKSSQPPLCLCGSCATRDELFTPYKWFKTVCIAIASSQTITEELSYSCSQFQSEYMDHKCFVKASLSHTSYSNHYTYQWSHIFKP